LQLLHNFAIGVLGFVILPLQGLYTQFILYANFTLIREWHEMDSMDILRLGAIALLAQVMWVTVLEFSGRFHQQSVKTIHSWKKFVLWSKRSRLYMKKFRLSCRPLYIGTEGFFVVRRLSVLKFLMAIVRGTFRAILTAKGYDAIHSLR
jgi:hypothetical protein